MKNNSFKYYHVVFDNSNEKILINIEKNKTIKELIEQYLQRKKKSNLLDGNFENLYFLYNLKRIPYKNNLQTVDLFLGQIQTKKFWFNVLTIIMI
jgi:hypothetical protein